MTPTARIGSHIFTAIALVFSAGCSVASADPLGVADKGIFGDLDARVQLTLPAGVDPASVTATRDEEHGVLVLWIDGHPRKVYPLELRPADKAELTPLLAASRTREATVRGDHDHDGIPDPLDILIGAKKTVLNADAYTEQAQGYIKLKYPGGDVDRSMGVCTDVVIRAVRNAGVDLQKELHEDILRRRSAFPMIRRAPDASIDQRRVGTLLPYFKKHWESHTPELDDPDDPYRPGDIILMDTFPSRSGPDHIGIISDTIGENGLPLVINNWTTGTVTSEMDLLTFVPVLYRFRLPART
jgi:uncharacterized protein YijF (DUF1287 family)